MIPVLHLVVLGSGPNRALIMLSRALPCCCLRVESLSLLSVNQSATPTLYSPHAAKSVTAQRRVTVRARRVNTDGHTDMWV